MVSKFSDSTGLGIAGNLDTGCDKIANGKGDNRARCICTFTVDSTSEAWLEVRVVVELRLRSKGKQKGQPTAGTQRIISVPSMGLMFQV